MSQACANQSPFSVSNVYDHLEQRNNLGIAEAFFYSDFDLFLKLVFPHSSKDYCEFLNSSFKADHAVRYVYN